MAFLNIVVKIADAKRALVGSADTIEGFNTLRKGDINGADNMDKGGVE